MAGASMPDNASRQRFPAGKDRAESERFEVPGYSGQMAALLDIIRYGPDLLGLPRTAILLFIAERTIPYRKLADAPSLAQMVDGVYVKHCDSIRWIRLGCGLKQSAAKEATASLVAMGFLEKQKRSDVKKGNLPTQYEIRWPALHSYFVDKSATKVPPLGRHTAKGSSEHLQTGPAENPLAATRLSPWPPHGQEQCLNLNSAGIPDLNSPSGVVHHHQQEEILECPLASLAVGKSSLGAETAAKWRARAISLPASRKADDDEEPAHAPTVAVEPKAAFLLRVAQRHPEIDARACLADVLGELRKGVIPLNAFLRRDLLTTTNPKALTNPRGYYRDLAKKMVAEHQKQMAGIPTETVVETPRCAKCNGTGYVLERIEGQGPLQTGEFCACKLGKDLAVLERRAARKAAAATEGKQPGQAPDQNCAAGRAVGLR